jgi:serine/threonine-protein kinase
MPLTGGEVFAGYVIQRLLGAGGMGEVYLAKHPRLPRLDAVKILPAALTDDADYRQRFNREADLAAGLWHPHVVGIHDRGEFNGQLWISMDYVDGTDAGRLLMDRYPNGMPESDVREIVTAVADALDFSHRRRLLHRDVKPSNILLTESGDDERRILLADFGIARQADDISGLTVTNMTVGSVAYAPPEQLMGEEIDGRADEYALAATAFHLLTGATPFPHSNPAVVITRQLNMPAPSLAQRRPDLARFDAALSKALAKDRDNRYPRCLDFARALGQEERQPATHAIRMPAGTTRRMSMPSSAAAGAPASSQPRPAPLPRVAPPPIRSVREAPAATPPAPRPPSPPTPPADSPPSRLGAVAPLPPKPAPGRSDRRGGQAIWILVAVLLLLAAVVMGGIAYRSYTRSDRGAANSQASTAPVTTAPLNGDALQPDH